MKKIEIWTDGACKGNPGIGGWGVFIKYELEEKFLYGNENFSTNNRMELIAVIKALEFINSKKSIILHTDSQYVMNGITKWIHNWQRNGWKTSANKLVKNIELWKILYQQNNDYNIQWNWIKGHSGNKGNEIADKLANMGILEYKNHYNNYI
ncbi:Ribonuclease HI [Candidatus Kinetoplastibacterium sorsogonicusi]|uniref:Ribonuclease H n=1 Tax=Candidatus Kinetoplastidibacterium kentomonadis TaxID=1576550 RepID=A0A3Q8ERW8_9PROT|nr:ribonuclease HI [Candidatus Kinetoplastibacterium sorsogonicusi]AWD32678.1 Ribonuclease HI [Candidatus Kinetoplastibacterium sorsogonicusi]